MQPGCLVSLHCTKKKLFWGILASFDYLRTKDDIELQSCKKVLILHLLCPMRIEPLAAR